MRKLTIRFAMAVITFLIGIAVAGLWTPYRFHRVEGTLTAKPFAADQKVTRGIPEGWKKVNIDGKFSFYLPPYMLKRKTRFRDYISTGGGYSENGGLFLDYEYGKHIYHGGCDNIAAFVNREARPYSEVLIGGKSAWLDDLDTKEEVGGWSSMNQWPVMSLCFSDIDNKKTKLFIEVVALFSQQLNEVKPIFDSIEFK